MINFVSQNKTFYLTTENTSYILKVLENGLLCHWYYGKRIADDNLDYYNLFGPRNYLPQFNTGDYRLSRDTAPLEYPTNGNGDFRRAALSVVNSYGQSVNDLLYKEHKITKGKPSLCGLPSFDTNTENTETLEIVLQDSVTGYEVSIFYSVFENEDAITRHSVIKNTTDKPITLASAQSVSLDFPHSDFDLITLHGAWARERHIKRRPLCDGAISVESRRGASGHQQNPFAALCSHDANEDNGDVYGFSLVYSGNFRTVAEVEQYGTARFQLGINPENFSYYLEPQESFVTPEAVMVYSDKGLSGMSKSFHNMCRNHLGKSADKNIKRPLLINSWEAMYFNMTEERIENFVKNCKGLGIDTFVLDDGWFGHRDSDNSSLGDWFVDKNKFPNGLGNVIKICKDNGMNFGIWFEPEMISRDSELFKKHPDWCIHAEGKEPIESRNQLVLDMSRPEVVECIYEQVAAILKEYDISYVKWDMNRNITDNGSPVLSPEKQGEHAHRYILGVYELMKKLTNDFPDVLFEGCAGGGGRFDFGILYYMPQFWTSDDTDAIERLKIQYGTSLVYPLSSMTAHVSDCPNHQTGRTVSFKTRGDVAQVCNFGYELDVSRISDKEKEQIKEQVALHKRIEPMIYEGDFYRLASPFEKEYCSWQVVSKDKKASFVVVAMQKASPHMGGMFIKLKGLEENTEYTVKELGVTLHGSTLMNAGILITKEYKDFATATFEIEAK